MKRADSEIADVVERITAMLVDNEAVDSSNVSSTAPFDVMGLDSLTLIELSMQIEAFYNTSISGGEIAGLQNLMAVSQEIVRRVGASHAA